MGKQKKSISDAEMKRVLVWQLEAGLVAFKSICSTIPEDSIDPKLREAIFELGLDVIHFINQYRMTDKAISDINNPPGASKNYEEREFFRWEIEAYQQKHPDRFPTWDEFSQELDKFNISRSKKGLTELQIESRTYDDWKKWWKIGEFDHKVHD